MRCLLMLTNMLEPRVEKDRFATGKEEYDGTKNRENDHSDLGIQARRANVSVNAAIARYTR